MPEPSEAVVRGAWDAYRAGDMSALLALVHPDLEWTYLDPAFARPRAADLPRRGQLAQALKRGQVRALTWDIEELAATATRSCSSCTPRAWTSSEYGRPASGTTWS